MDLLALYNTVKADRGRTPKAPKDWKKKILNANAVAPKDDWDFANLSDNTISRRAQFESLWQERELLYIIQPVHCRYCGWQHDEHWGIFLREVHRSNPSTVRMKRLGKSIADYRHLPREVVTNEALPAPSCARCFLEGTGPEQLELAINDLSPLTIVHLGDALHEVSVEHEKHMKWKEKKGPEVYDFDTDFADDKPLPKPAVKTVDELEW